MSKSEFHIPGEIAAFKLPEFEVAVAHAAAKSFKTSKEAQQWARRELQGRTFTNADTGMQISIGRNAIDKFTSASASLKSSDTAAHFSAIKVLPGLLHNAIEGERRAERDNVRHVKAVHRFFAALKIGAKYFRVKLTVFSYHEHTDGRFYTHELAEIEMPAESWAPVPVCPKTTASDALHAGAIKLGDLLRGVKRDDGSEYFPASPTSARKAKK